MNPDFDLDKEPLWSIPQPVQERLRQDAVRSEVENFRLSVLYSAVAVFFLVGLGISSVFEGNARHGTILMMFAVVAIAGHLALWLGHWYGLGKHFTTTLMAILCLYLFHSGGVLNTGPLYYGVFPSVALFLQGRFRGFIWVIALLGLTVIMSQGAFGFDVSRYSSTFVSRVIVITLIITLLTCIPEYFRIKAERNLMLSINDLEALTYGDLATQLANRALLEKLLMQEFNRNRRYGSECCVMMIEQDPVSRTLTGLDTGAHSLVMRTMVADVLRRNLRIQDVAGRWENNRFMLLLPESNVDGCKVLADRLLAEVRAEAGRFGKFPLKVTASIGIAAIDNDPHEVLLERVINRLQEARRRGGNCYVAG